LSPTIFRAGPFRFYFFSREEPRLHVHVQSDKGEVKLWLDPEIQVAKNYNLKERDLQKIRELIREHEDEIRDAWKRHFGG
jgi:Domain of unknown function (DUF4160)